MTVRLEPSVEEGIRHVAEELHVSVDFAVSEIVARYLEDRADYAAGIRALSEMKHCISLDELERRSNVAD